MFKIGDKVKIKNNLGEELKRLEFDDYVCKNFQKTFVNTEQEIFSLWKDKYDGQEYATIDLCVEIPIQCLELINN